MRGIPAEVIVVDNHSADGSIDFLAPAFPEVRFIRNQENVGFAKACNQGLGLSSGSYILFLNPDTIVPEDCFKKCISFLAGTPGAGALGIRMLDGSGKFLKESKRAFPGPATSLYKLAGLASLFPRSRVFSRYHLGHLDEKQTSEVDVLAGAFMMVKREVLERVGSFDEGFFMYGEDVDLSYRIQKAGYRNFYFAGSSIMHFKGESTRKGTLNYVRMFYNAMSIFVRKHYGGSRAGIFNFLIHLAIWFRAVLTATGTFIRKAGLPLIDAGLILLSFWLVKNIWTEQVRPDIQYENRLLWIAFPAYTVFFLVAAYYAGLYDRWYKWSGLFQSMLIATVFLLAAYSLLPEHYRFSRGIIMFGAILAFLFISLLRYLLVKTNVLSSDRDKLVNMGAVVAGSKEEYEEVLGLFKAAGQTDRVLGRIAVEKEDDKALAYLQDIPKLSSTIPFRQLVLCRGVLSFAEIINLIPSLPKGIKAKIHTTGSSSIITSASKDSSGEVMSKENAFKLGMPYNRRLKRLIDVAFALFFLLTFPFHFIFIKGPISFFANCFKVLAGSKTWIGYAIGGKNLPSIPPAVIGCNGLPVLSDKKLPVESLQLVDHWYARDYEPLQDLKMIARKYRQLGS